MKNHIALSIKQYLKENLKNDTTIYHFTENLDSLDSILFENKLTSGAFNGRFGRGYDNISFTWNESLWDVEYVGDVEPRYKVRISLDYNKLSKDFDLNPFDYGIEEEKEEIFEGDIIDNIKKYIIEISIKKGESIMDIKYFKDYYQDIKFKTV